MRGTYVAQGGRITGNGGAGGGGGQGAGGGAGGGGGGDGGGGGGGGAGENALQCGLCHIPIPEKFVGRRFHELFFYLVEKQMLPMALYRFGEKKRQRDRETERWRERETERKRDREKEREE